MQSRPNLALKRGSIRRQGELEALEFPVERLYRDAPLMCIGEGTNEMQRIIIARQLMERNPA